MISLKFHVETQKNRPKRIVLSFWANVRLNKLQTFIVQKTGKPSGQCAVSIHTSPVDIIVIDGKHKVPLSSGLVDIHLQDLVLG